MRVVIDTNVLVSAVILPKSKLGEILLYIRSGSVTSLSHPAILAELVRVLDSNRIQKRFHPAPADIQVAVELVVRLIRFLIRCQPIAARGAPALA